MFNDTCKITCVDNGRIVDADILDFKEKKILIVSLNKSVKLTLKWNGKVYEGNSVGLTFTTNGPTIR